MLDRRTCDRSGWVNSRILLLVLLSMSYPLTALNVSTSQEFLDALALVAFPTATDRTIILEDGSLFSSSLTSGNYSTYTTKGGWTNTLAFPSPSSVEIRARNPLKAIISGSLAIPDSFSPGDPNMSAPILNFDQGVRNTIVISGIVFQYGTGLSIGGDFVTGHLKFYLLIVQ